MVNNEIKRLRDLLNDAYCLASGEKAPSTTTTTTNKVDQKIEREKEIEDLKKRYDRIYAENKGKISQDFPSTIFDKKKRNEEK